MWKGRAVDVLAAMRPLTDMAFAKVHVVMQVQVLRTGGQIVCSGHVCNLRVKHQKWFAKASRRLQDAPNWSHCTDRGREEGQIAKATSHML